MNSPIFDALSTGLVETSVILSYSDGINQFEWNNLPFTYSNAETPVIHSVSPKIGTVKGNEVLTLIGTSLSGIPQITIDGKVCEIL